MKTLQIRSMPEDLHQELTRQAAEKGMSLNRLLLGFLGDIARINRHLTVQGKQRTDHNADVLRRSREREGPTPSRHEIVDAIREIRGVE